MASEETVIGTITPVKPKPKPKLVRKPKIIPDPHINLKTCSKKMFIRVVRDIVKWMKDANAATRSSTSFNEETVQGQYWSAINEMTERLAAVVENFRRHTLLFRFMAMLSNKDQLSLFAQVPSAGDYQVGITENVTHTEWTKVLKQWGHVETVARHYLTYVQGGYGTVPFRVVYEELKHLAENYPSCVLNRQAKTLSVELTSEIRIALSDEDIENLEDPRYQAEPPINFGTFSVVIPFTRFRSMSLNPDVKVRNENPTKCKEQHKTDLYHPHVSSSGDLCQGEAKPLLMAAFHEGRFSSFVEIVESVLRTFNSTSPYAGLETWTETYETICKEIEAKQKADRLEMEAKLAATRRERWFNHNNTLTPEQLDKMEKDFIDGVISEYDHTDEEDPDEDNDDDEDEEENTWYCEYCDSHHEEGGDYYLRNCDECGAEYCTSGGNNCSECSADVCDSCHVHVSAEPRHSDRRNYACRDCVRTCERCGRTEFSDEMDTHDRNPDDPVCRICFRELDDEADEEENSPSDEEPGVAVTPPVEPNVEPTDETPDQLAQIAQAFPEIEDPELVTADTVASVHPDASLDDLVRQAIGG